MFANKAYIISLRREIHQYPELEFELPKTIALVKRELDKLNVEYTENFGKSSVVATINPEKQFTICIRADMDGLPITETNDIPYKSKIEGRMHACGHDAHTAILLGVIEYLSKIKDKLSCCVKFIFQPNEETEDSGAKMLVDNGVLNGADLILSLHVDGNISSGKIGVCKGPSFAASRSFRIDFFGKSAHGTMPSKGVDALSASVCAYNDIQRMLNSEIDKSNTYVSTICKLDAGTTMNVIADHAYMLGTTRTFNKELDDFIINRMTEIANDVAKNIGAKATVQSKLYVDAVYNNPFISNRLISSASKVIGKENVIEPKANLYSEDFSYYTNVKPGVMFMLGTRNEQKGITTLVHNNDFMIDEDALSVGANVFIQFILDNMNGIKKENLT